ncbi:formylglycine-generating enzyme family protein [Enhygromyxa salina]|uniref:formylglycine-generating enzyme family protein n=1 Tax=Enhygromyxa salina TaxID=215803 RepID=UPI0011BA5C16
MARESSADNPEAQQCPAGTRAIAAAKLRLSSFCLAVTEVTVGAYHECVRGGRCVPPPKLPWGTYGRGDPRLPVSGVTWHAASQYCEWTGGRLPSFIEWRWAYRGGSAGLSYPWGEDWDDSASCLDGTLERPCVVGSTADITADGVYDMHANLSEWTSDIDADGEAYLVGQSWRSDIRGMPALYVSVPLETVAPTIGFRCAYNR